MTYNIGNLNDIICDTVQNAMTNGTKNTPTNIPRVDMRLQIKLL